MAFWDVRAEKKLNNLKNFGIPDLPLNRCVQVQIEDPMKISSLLYNLVVEKLVIVKNILFHADTKKLQIKFFSNNTQFHRQEPKLDVAQAQQLVLADRRELVAQVWDTVPFLEWVAVKRQ